MDKIDANKKLDDVVENFRKDMALFAEDSQRPCTESDLARLASMTYYAISDIAKVIKQL